MMRGKHTCRILKEIRRKIAEANDIEFVTSECRYQGDCSGTCPKCEAEVRYLERQLRMRQLMGKAVVLAGVSAGVMGLSGCGGATRSHPVESDAVSLADSVEMADVMEDSIDAGEAPLMEDTVVSKPTLLNVITVVGEVPEVKQGEIVDVSSAAVDRSTVDVDSVDVDKIYYSVDQPPEYPGGMQAMLQFISENLRYPEEQLEEGIQGRVIIKFYVDTLGRVCNPAVDRGKDSALDKEALRVVGMFPDYTPGMINGRRVNTWVRLPIVFKLPAVD